MDDGILNGIKVIELASVLAAPSVGMFLAELGAEVIKIENPKTGGDVTRSWKLPSESIEDASSSYYKSVNWGKKSLFIDITSQDGYQHLCKLISDADILLVSFKPGDDKKLKLGYEEVALLNPRLIYASITGFGPNDIRTAYDALLQAETGFMDLNRPPGGSPGKMPVALIDILASHHLKELILVAYIHRLKTGQGSHVEVSLFEAAVSSLANQAGSWLYAGKNPVPLGSEHPHIYPYGGLFTTFDGKQLILAVGNDAQFSHLCKVLKMHHLAQDSRFKTNPLRSANRNELRPLLEEAILTRNSELLLENLHSLKVPSGLVRTVADAVETYAGLFSMHTSDSQRGVPILSGRINGKRASKSLALNDSINQD